MSRTATLVGWVAGLAAIAATGAGTLALAKDPPRHPEGARGHDPESS
jgi:hypothetical protein